MIKSHQLFSIYSFLPCVEHKDSCVHHISKMNYLNIFRPFIELVLCSILEVGSQKTVNGVNICHVKRMTSVLIQNCTLANFLLCQAL